MGNQLRLHVIIAFSVLALLCGPIWYHTTRVVRAPLPHRTITRLSNQATARAQVLVRLVLPRGVCGTKSFVGLAGGARFHMQTAKFDAHWLDAAPAALADDGAARRLLDATARLPRARAGQFDVIAVADESVPPTWGVERVAWFGLRRGCDNVVDAVTSLLQMHVVDTLAPSPGVPRSPALLAALPAGGRRRAAVKSAPVYHATFTLLSSDPQSVRAQWDFGLHERRFLAPLLRKLERVAAVVVTSQVLHYAPLARLPDDAARNELGEFVVDTAHVQQLVDPHSWRLNSIETNATTLHFVVFVPPAGAPLRLRNADGSLSLSNAFLLPQWGGVVIRNLPRDAAARALDSGEPQLLALTGADDLAAEMGVFVGQLKRLLGLPSADEQLAGRLPQLPPPTLTAPPDGITEYEIDYILIEHMYENLANAKSIMHSQSRLVDSLTTMKVLGHIRVLLERAIDAIARAEHAMLAGDLETAYAASTTALVDAETAFFDRDMIAMLYYPTEHNLAIYLSFFLPMSLPFFSSAWAELGRWREKRRKAAEAAKLALQNASVTAVSTSAKGNDDE